MEPKKKTH